MINPSDINFKLSVQDETDTYAKVVIDPLLPGFGQTMGNSLRRVMLTYLSGAAVTSVQVEGIQHQFTTLKGMRQDIVDFVLNLKQLNIVYSGTEPVVLSLKAKKGSGQVTASQIDLPSGVEITNPELVLADLSTGDNLDAKITVESGVGYSPAEERNISTVGVIPVDAGFSPVVRVNYEVLSTRVGRLTNFDKVVFEIWTNGTMKAIDAVLKSAELLEKYFAHVSEPTEEDENTSAQVEDINDGTPRESLQLTVEELELPTRIANALRKSGLGTVKDLLSASQEDIMKVKNLGGKSINIIQDALKAKGIDFA